MGSVGVIIEADYEKNLMVHILGDMDNRWIAFENSKKISVVSNGNAMDDTKMDDGVIDVLTMEVHNTLNVADDSLNLSNNSPTGTLKSDTNTTTSMPLYLGRLIYLGRLNRELEDDIFMDELRQNLRSLDKTYDLYQIILALSYNFLVSDRAGTNTPISF